ncbi:putative transposase [Rhizobium sp. PP-CC-2G-626]|nr:putative transposase [Rhizobium sp. PP-CC-2G-626]
MIGDDEQRTLSEQEKVSEGGVDLETPRTNEPKTKSRNSDPGKRQTADTAKRQIKRHTASERADKLRQVEESLTRGGMSLKAAVEAVGISDQTYYQWKRAGKPANAAAAKSTPPSPHSRPVPTASLGNELADLIKLEEENQRLRQLLAEKLRAENTELRRRLEMD